MEVTQTVNECINVVQWEEVEWPRTPDRGEESPSHFVEISPSHRAENLVLAVSELAHLSAEFRDKGRTVPCRPISTCDQVERHLKLYPEPVTARSLAVGVAIMLTRAARLALAWHIAEATERTNRA